MSQIIVKLKKGEDGKIVAMVGVALQVQATFKGGIWEAVGRRQIGKKFIDAACKELVKKIGPKLQEALTQEQKYYEHPETIPATPEGDLNGARTGLHPALAGSGAPHVPGVKHGGPDQSEVQGSDKEPDNRN
jgi:hypothetical protein